MKVILTFHKSLFLCLLLSLFVSSFLCLVSKKIVCLLLLLCVVFLDCLEIFLPFSPWKIPQMFPTFQTWLRSTPRERPSLPQESDKARKTMIRHSMTIGPMTDPWDRYIYLHEWLILIWHMVNVGRYTRHESVIGYVGCCSLHRSTTSTVGCTAPSRQCSFVDFMKYSFHNWLVVLTHLKNISQIGSFPQIGMKIQKYHQPDKQLSNFLHLFTTFPGHPSTRIDVRQLVVFAQIGQPIVFGELGFRGLLLLSYYFYLPHMLHGIGNFT